MCFQKLRCFFYFKKNNKGLNKNWFHEKIFKQTLYGIDFFHDSLNEFDGCGGPQVIVKQLDCTYQKISLPGKSPSDRLSVGWIACCVNQKL